MPAIDPLAASAPTPVATTRPPADQMGKDTFLKLLVAQLKYQDPMKPADSSAFLAQSAQFTMVEKLEELARHNAESLATQRLLVGSSLLGREVTYAGSDGQDATGLVAGVRVEGDRSFVRVGGVDVPIGAVKEVAPPTPA